MPQLTPSTFSSAAYVTPQPQALDSSVISRAFYDAFARELDIDAPQVVVADTAERLAALALAADDVAAAGSVAELLTEQLGSEQLGSEQPDTVGRSASVVVVLADD